MGLGETSLDTSWHTSPWCNSSEHWGTPLIAAHECWTCNIITYSTFALYDITQTSHRARRGKKKQHQVTTNSSPSKERDQSSALWCGFSQRGGVTQNHCSQRLGTKTLSFSLLSWPSRLQGSPALGNSTCSLCAGYVPQDPAQRGNCPPLKWKLKSLQNKCSDSSGSKGSL